MGEEKKKKIWSIIINILLIVVVIALVAVSIFLIYNAQKEKNSEENKLSYTQLID